MGNVPSMGGELPIAFVAPGSDATTLEIRVNFGVFAGREATPAELDDLGRAAMAEAGHVTVVSEHRQELGGRTETSLHQVRLEVEVAPRCETEAEWFRDRFVGLAERWAQRCIETRHADVVEPLTGNGLPTI